MKKSVLAIILLGGCAAVSPMLVAASGASNSDFGIVIRALEGQIDLLKWVGTAVIGGLSVAVTTLYFALVKSHKESTDLHVKSVVSADKLGDAIDKLNVQLQNRPCILKDEK